MIRHLLYLFFIFFCLNSIAQELDSLKGERFSIHAQTTVITQYKPEFSAPYSGENSLTTEKETQTSITATLYLGLKLWKGASIFLNPEIAGGSGLSQTLGIAAATNGETFRVGSTAPQVYLARLFFNQMFDLNNQKQKIEHNYFHHHSDFNQLDEYVPTHYFSITIGKVGIADYFDDNKFSHDPRTQFMCWALMSNGAWDYPANTRGYTPSVVLEYVTPINEFRYGYSLVPLAANGNTMDWNFAEAGSHTLEYTHKHKIKNKEGTIRLLGFFTNAKMGNYSESIALNPISPDIETTRKNGHTKYGFGINAEQDITQNFGCFLRASWNDGNNETWAFTEIDKSISGGINLMGNKWKRKADNVGIAYVASGISASHLKYLQAGGKGFMLGDGNLNYAYEQLAEVYYSFALVKDQIFVTGTYQFLMNPGYNADRQGPVNIYSVRLHARI
jgi:high affinity Mn2+ porin